MTLHKIYCILKTVPAICLVIYMKLIPYLSSSGKDMILDYIDRLPTDEKVDGMDVLQQMQQGNFDSIHMKTWEGKIKEVYFYKHNRIFFVMAFGDTVYLLHACRKQKNRTEKKDAAIVRKRAAELNGLLKAC